MPKILINLYCKIYWGAKAINTTCYNGLFHFSSVQGNARKGHANLIHSVKIDHLFYSVCQICPTLSF